MDQSFFEQSSRESLQEENEFMKMKLMLERGAVFGGFPAESISPEVENDFLRSIFEMEAQFEQAEMTTIYEKIGRPTHFKPVEQLSEQAIDQAWDQLYDCLQSHAIQLVACSPYVSNRELYRFVTEEFFQVEIEACDPPDVVSVFYYDYFHPDPFYENTETALHDCMRDVFRPKAGDQYFYMLNGGIQLNERTDLTREEYIQKLNSFYGLFDELEILLLEDSGCRVHESECIVSGKYSVRGYSGKETFLYSGTWTVTFIPDADRYFWYVQKVMLEGYPV
jgi:hypothetical protein